MKGKFWPLAFIFIFFLAACSSKKKVSLSGEEPVDIKNFIGSFDLLTLPFELDDTSLVKKSTDTLLIGFRVISHLVPDSVLGKVFGKSDRPRIYPIGRVSGPDKGTYLFIKAFSAEHSAALILCFDRKNNFIAGMPVLVPDANPATRQYFVMDKRYTISKNVTRRNPDGTTKEGKNVYVLNEPARTFLLIMTDALDEQKIEVVNPIESMPRKNKYSGDYVKDKWNLVSIRDDKKTGRMHFFIHFEKKNNCGGELKGEAAFTSGNTALYRSGGEFCVLQFSFNTSSVTLTEIEGCGSHRGVECAFEGSFPKKKESRKEVKKVRRVR